MAMKFKIDKLKGFFKTMAEIEKRIEEIAPLCTNITSREDIIGFSQDDDSICIKVWSSDCGNDAYWFPLEYLTMDNVQIEKCEKMKAELARILREKEELKEKKAKKKAKERAERREYERLKKKYEGG